MGSGFLLAAPVNPDVFMPLLAENVVQLEPCLLLFLLSQIHRLMLPQIHRLAAPVNPVEMTYERTRPGKGGTGMRMALFFVRLFVFHC